MEFYLLFRELLLSLHQSIDGMMTWHLSPKYRPRCFLFYMSLIE